MIVELNEQNFDEEIKSGLKVVEFAASWCGFCRKQKAILDELSQIRFGQVDGDESPNLISKYKIKGYPTFVIFEDGDEIFRFSGLQNKYDLMNNLSQFFE